MKAITKEWIGAAKDDLAVIDKIISTEYLSHMVAFHAQQCIEKCLKGVIEEYDLPSIRIHSLERLFEVVKNHVHLDQDNAVISELDKLYTDARYPGEMGLLPHGKPTLKDAKKFYQFAKDTFRKVKATLQNT